RNLPAENQGERGLSRPRSPRWQSLLLPAARRAEANFTLERFPGHFLPLGLLLVGHETHDLVGELLVQCLHLLAAFFGEAVLEQLANLFLVRLNLRPHLAFLL